jgi:hypothetical protein
MKDYFIVKYETEFDTVFVAYWITKKGYYYRHVQDETKLKRISEQEYTNAYDAYRNY